MDGSKESSTFVKPKSSSEKMSRPSTSSSARSDISESVSLEAQILDLLKVNSIPGTLKGERITMLKEQNFDAFMNALSTLLHDDKEHSVPKAQLASLNSQLARLKLERSIGISKSQELEDSLLDIRKRYADLKEIHAKEKGAADLAIEVLQKERQGLTDHLKTLKAELKGVNDDLKRRSATENDDQLKVTKELRDSLGTTIETLNHKLTIKNENISLLKNRASTLQKEVESLNMELNIARANLDIAKREGGVTYASAAIKKGKENVHMVGGKILHLTKASWEWLNKAQSETDVRAKAFDLKVSIDKSKAKNPQLAGLSSMLGDILHDMRYVAYSSRKQFVLILNAIQHKLETPGLVLDEKEIRDLFSQLDPDKMYLKKEFQNSDIRTLGDAIRLGVDLNKINMTHIEAKPDEQEELEQDLEDIKTTAARIADVRGPEDDIGFRHKEPRTFLGRFWRFVFGSKVTPRNPSLLQRLYKKIVKPCWGGLKFVGSFFRYDKGS